MPQSEVYIDDRELKDYFRDLLNKTKDPGQYLLVAVNTHGFRDVIEHFRKEEGPSGPWKKRSPATDLQYQILNQKNKMYNPTNKLLQLSGNLRGSFLPNSTAGGSEKVDNVTVKMYTLVPYAWKHQYGDDRNRIPERKFLWLSKDSIGRMADMLVQLILGG